MAGTYSIFAAQIRKYNISPDSPQCTNSNPVYLLSVMEYEACFKLLYVQSQFTQLASDISIGNCGISVS